LRSDEINFLLIQGKKLSGIIGESKPFYRNKSAIRGGILIPLGGTAE
jgi:hypothetical protein